ncbi:hypothetical protein F5X99DRAFT_364244 [Biscogniauxia marginata]|nr:hypothetical protein F5X99DRAFT_364244 [Biscogniauxia marginata]
MASSNFRVIVAGGGPIGLTAAHMLSKAEIDFIVLEKRDTIIPQAGSSITTLPQTLRVYDQLGLLHSARAVSHIMDVRYQITLDGYRYNTTRSFQRIAENHGHYLLIYHRSDLLKMLYDELSDADKSKILMRKTVADIDIREDGVLVKCEDGTSFEGSIVIGADGVHSRVRNLMRSLALSESPHAVVNDEKPFLTSFRCMFGTMELVPGLVVLQSWSSHGTGITTQLFVQPGKASFFVYEKLKQPTRERVRYSEKDQEQFVERLGDICLTDTMKFKDLWEAKLSSVLTNLEEGTVKVWTWNRIAIAGDAANKMTPNSGVGYNSGVQDLVVLVTELRSLLDRHPGGEPISTESVQEALDKYQKTRCEEAANTCREAGSATRLQAWANWIYWLLDRYILSLPIMNRWIVDTKVGGWVRKGRVLPFLEEKSLGKGKIPWVYLPEVVTKKVGVDLSRSTTSS